MGLEIDRHEFGPEERARFSARLARSVEALAELTARPGFGDGARSIGIEVEMALVDAAGRPLAANQAIQRHTGNPRVALEIARFNIEYASHPAPLDGRPFAAIEAEVAAAVRAVAAAAGERGGRIALIGTLPTLTREDLLGVITDTPRYRALSAEIRRGRERPFHVSVDGPEPLDFRWDDVAPEGANSSLQVHLRVPAPRFRDTFNAALMASVPALAAAGNSPVLLGHLLWDETRVPLFEQAVDDRPATAPWRPPRVAFGHGWVRSGPVELFAQGVALHPPLLPVLDEESGDPLDCVRAGGVPPLTELRLHQGTVWNWVRPVYDPTDGGSVRMELRAIGAGPTLADMSANAAFLVGLTLGLAPDADRLADALPFRNAEQGFYAAARHGLDAGIAWPSPSAPSPRREPAADLVVRLLPVARTGLLEAGVDPAEADRLLGVVQERVESGRTGARWQRRALAARDAMPRPEALHDMLEAYIALSADGSGPPVARWESPRRTAPASRRRASASEMRP